MADLHIYLGFDSAEPVTFAVAMHSILKRASRPVTVTPLVQSSLRTSKIYTRERAQNEATEFSLTRFLCPSLSHFDGYSLFLDSDVLVQCDIFDLLLYATAYPDKAVYVAQHAYQPKAAVKFDGHTQTVYAKKNWSSVMLFRNDRCRSLTPEYVNTATGLMLHRFWWLEDDQIGSLPLDFNWLVGEYAPNPAAKILHYTNGAPCFEGYADCDHAGEWWAEYAEMLKPGKAVEASVRNYTQVAV